MTKIEEFPLKKVMIDDIKFDKTNPNSLSPEKMEALTQVMQKFGYLVPVILNKKMQVIDGEHRVRIYRKMGEKKIPSYILDTNKVDSKMIRQVMNKLTGDHDKKMDSLEYKIIHQAGKLEEFAELLGTPSKEFKTILEQRYDEIDFGLRHPKILSERFGSPPFSILDAKQGYWQDRKKKWLAFGVESTEGRKDDLTYKGINHLISGTGNEQWYVNNLTSTFDPVLCEIMYQWFCPKNGDILDPFAGGSVRGIVAAMKGYNYTGIDLAQEQVDANKKNVTIMKSKHKPKWICGDSQDMDTLLPADKKLDFLFSCPPYFDLEIYTDDKKDISNMTYQQFQKVYTDILSKSIKRLRPNSFAVIVIQNIRNKEGGFFINLVGDTISAFEKNGMKMYNDMILATQIASVPLRAPRPFLSKRKIAKVHQNVLCFYKGDTDKIAKLDKEDVIVDVV